MAHHNVWSMSFFDARDGDGTSQKEGIQCVKRCVFAFHRQLVLCAMGKTEKQGITTFSSAEQSPHAVPRREFMEIATVAVAMEISVSRGKVHWLLTARTPTKKKTERAVYFWDGC